MTEQQAGSREEKSAAEETTAAESARLRERYRQLSAELAAVVSGEIILGIVELDDKESELEQIDARLRQIGGDWEPLQPEAGSIEPRAASESLGDIQDSLRHSQKSRLEAALANQKVLQDQVAPAVNKDLAETEAWREQLRAADQEVEAATASIQALGEDPQAIIEDFNHQMSLRQAETEDDE